MDNAISTLVGEELERNAKWIGTVAGVNNGSLYGIPGGAGVAKFNSLDKSIIEIGPDFVDGCKWSKGAMTDSGVIYCPPCNIRHGSILKIDTNTDNVTELDVNIFPHKLRCVIYMSRAFTFDGCMWASCAAALDGCIYFMPYDEGRIMKLDPNNGDAMSSVGDDLGKDNKYIGAVVGIDGCVYAMPLHSSLILRYDPINETTSFFGEEANEDFCFSGNGVLGRNGCIYAATYDGLVLKIDTTNNSHCLVGNRVESDHDGNGWGDAILGIDGCIYWPPMDATHILKYDPHSNLTSLEGGDFGRGRLKWSGGCSAPDGVIYCLPSSATRVLAIDPLREYTLSLKNNMEECPEQLGRIFQPSDDIPDETNFDRAVTKFGQKKVLELLEDCMPPADQVYALSNLYPFMTAASSNKSRVCVIYHLLRQTPSFVNCMKEAIDTANHTMHCDKKRKYSAP